MKKAIHLFVFLLAVSTACAQVELYSDWHFSGAKKTITSDWSVSDAGDSWNDVISSIKVPEGWIVTIYWDINFQGESKQINGNWDVSGPQDRWNDKISSIRVRRRTPGNAAVIGAEITFNTTSDDKDWDTKPFADVYLGGQTVASLDCCSSDRNGDHWGSGSVTRSLNIHANVPKQEIMQRGTCILGAQGGAHGAGNDTWKLNASLKINYSDGTSSYHSGRGWSGIEFYSRSRSRESTTPISLAN